METLIRRCQALGVEPFRFAESAAFHFPTLQRWTDFHWRERFTGASIAVRVSIADAGRTH